MNDQQIFNKVARHLLKQNKRSAYNGTCQYHTDKGLRCAIGCLIPKRLYIDSMESYTIEDLLQEYPEALTGVSNKNLPLLIKLQNVHDFNQPAEWRDHLRLAADSLGLSTHRVKGL